MDGLSQWWWIEEDVQTFGFIAGDWENIHKENITKYMKECGKEYGVVVQAGGNCGMYPLLLSRLFGAVYTFEPDPFNFTTLALNCSSSNNVVKIQGALGAQPGFITVVHRTMQNVGMHQVREMENSTIPLFNLDSFAFKKIDFLWLDIEEYEINAFKGAIETIKRCKPLIFCENPTEDIQRLLRDETDCKMIGRSGMDGVFSALT